MPFYLVQGAVDGLADRRHRSVGDGRQFWTSLWACGEEKMLKHCGHGLCLVILAHGKRGEGEGYVT